MRVRSVSAVLVLASLGVVAASTMHGPTADAAPTPPTGVAVDYELRERTASPDIKQQLAGMRQNIAAQKRSYTVGYTTALDRPIGQLATLKVPALPLGHLKQQSVEAEKLVR